MGSDADRFADATARRKRVTEPKHPAGFEPGLEYDEHGGTGVVAADDIHLGPGELPDEHWLIHRFGLDPDVWAIIDGTLNVRQWQRYDGQFLHYFKAQLRRRTPAEIELVDSLIGRLSKRPKIKPAKRSDAAFVAVVTDTQIGKKAGGGTDAFLSRFADSTDQLIQRLEQLRDRGPWGLSHVVVMAGGDMLEGISGQYASQPFQIDLCLRDQLEIAAGCMDYLIDRLVDAECSQVDVGFVPSNHGEQRSGKSIATEERDSTDLMIADQLRRAYSKHPRYGHVNIVVPWDNDTTICIDANGTRVGLAHGHQTGRKKVTEWWKSQIAGGVTRPLHNADILVVGHRHHLLIEEIGEGRTLIQCPALDGGSSYFAEMTGEHSPPGVVSFVAVDGRPRELDLIRTS